MELGNAAIDICHVLMAGEYALAKKILYKTYDFHEESNFFVRNLSRELTIRISTDWFGCPRVLRLCWIRLSYALNLAFVTGLF